MGVDADSGVVHTVTGTATNGSDLSETQHLLHGQEKRGQGDAGYTGEVKRPEIQAKFPHVAWLIAAKRGRIKKMAEGPRKEVV